MGVCKEPYVKFYYLKPIIQTHSSMYMMLQFPIVSLASNTFMTIQSNADRKAI